MSLRLRLFLLTVVLFATGLLVAGLAVPGLVRGFLVDRVDGRLEAAAIAAVGQLRVGTFGGPQPDGPSFFDVEGGYVRVETAEGEVLAERFLDPSTTAQPPDLPTTAELLAGRGDAVTVSGTGAGDRTDYRAAVVELPPAGATAATTDGLVITVALPLDDVDDALDRIVAIEIGVGAAVLVLVAVGTWWLVGVGLRPLRRMESTADAIRADRFEGDGRRRRVEHPSPRTEIGRLGETLNGMLDEIDGAFERQAASEARLRRFVADASHELRTPLTSIRGYAQLMRRAGEDPAVVATSVARIDSESTRMASLVEDLLTLARFDEHPRLSVEPVDLVALATDVARDVGTVAPDRDVRTVASGPVVVPADRGRVVQAVLNLVENARAHTPPGSPLELHVREDAAAGHAAIDVVDHGPGISEVDKARVFDRFTRLDEGRSRPAGGAGLGLAIVRAIATAHGGDVTVSDTPGGGATFTFTLPLADATARH